MPLQPGDKLGPYEVVALLGKGGMGEVYRARDPKLNRDVAIKVLPAALASDADYLTRFQREAQTLAALNHPNIAAIYGLESDAIVMELVEGDTLQGPLAIKDALPLAKQIAEALEAAHEKGIIHRDLKPGNIKVTPEGVVKVLDFGLAKAVNERHTQSGTDSPTLTLRATEAGLILGTAGYMSPEQAAGKPVDRRADIWSFGVVLYELLTGKRMFDGETVTHTLADVVRAPIDLALVEDRLARNIIARCLDRNIKNRLQHIGEARIAIDSYAHTQPQVPAPAKTGWWPWAIAGALALVCLVAGIGWFNASRPAPPRPLINLTVEIDRDKPFDSTDRGGRLALSPDGRRLALTLSGADGNRHLYTRALSQHQVTLLTGTENATSPFFSPDGDWIAFFADGKLKKVSVDGGAPVTLCEVASTRGGSWGDDGNIITPLDGDTALSRIPANGGIPAPATKLSPGETTHRWPHVLPGSQAMLFTAAISRGSYDNANIDVISFKTGQRKTIVRGGFSPRYVPSANGAGHLIYLHRTTLFAVPFNPTSLTASGTPTPILENVGSDTNGGGHFAFANSGTFVYLAGAALSAGWPISWLDSTNKTQPLHAPLGRYYNPRFSPDGRRLAFSVANSTGGSDIWVKDLERDAPSRLSFLPGTNFSPVWTPDGKTMVFTSLGSAPGLYAVRADGAGEAKRLTDGNSVLTAQSFSPDGKRLAVARLGSRLDLYTLPVEAGAAQGAGEIRLGKAELFLETKFSESDPAFSPDGRWLAYQSDESGTPEIYVRPFPGPGGRWQVSSGGGTTPVWSRDGRELLFHAPGAEIMAVIYAAKGDSFTAGKPRKWSETRVMRQNSRSFDPAPDGRRLAAIPLPEDMRNAQFVFLLNFFDELRRKAPVN